MRSQKQSYKHFLWWEWLHNGINRGTAAQWFVKKTITVVSIAVTPMNKIQHKAQIVIMTLLLIAINLVAGILPLLPMILKLRIPTVSMIDSQTPHDRPSLSL